MSITGEVTPEPVDIRGDVTVVMKGEDGLSAYEVAVKNGFVGTEEEWLESLKGEARNAEAYAREAQQYSLSAQNSSAAANSFALAAEDYKNEAQAIKDSISPEVQLAITAIQEEKAEAEAKKSEVDAEAEQAHLDRVQADADAAEVRYLYGETIIQKNVATDAAERARRYAQGIVDRRDEMLEIEARARDYAAQAESDAESAHQSAESASHSMTLASHEAYEARQSAILASYEAYEAKQSAESAAHSMTLASFEAYQAQQWAIDAHSSAMAAGNAETVVNDAVDIISQNTLDIVQNELDIQLAAMTTSMMTLASSTAQSISDLDVRLSDEITLLASSTTQQINTLTSSMITGLDNKLDVLGTAVLAENALRANGHTVESDVPPNAVFTDTTYDIMTISEAETGTDTTGKLVPAKVLADFVAEVIAALVASAPGTLDTLNELAAALGDDPNFATTVATELGKKLDKAGGVVTGDLTVNGTFTADVTGNVSGSSGSCTGNAATATKLATARTLWGASFDGSGNVSGNMSSVGSVTYSDTAADATRNLLYAKMGANDYFRVLVGGANNAGYAEIATADDGNEPIYVRQYSGAFATLTRTATLLDGSGNTTFPGKVTASGGFAGALTGNVTGNCSGSSGSCTGNAATATTARRLNNLSRSTAYAVGDIAYLSSMKTYFRLECVTAGTTAASQPTYANTAGTIVTDGTAKFIVDDIRDGTPVGRVQPSTFLPAGYVKLEGGTVNRANYPRLVTLANTYSLWTSDTTNNPGLFGTGNGSTTMVLPNWSNRMAQFAAAAGAKLDAGLPNVQGRLHLHGWSIISSGTDGAFGDFESSNTKIPAATYSDTGYGYTTFKASRSNSIYGSSTTVQPPAIKVFAIMRY